MRSKFQKWNPANAGRSALKFDGRIIPKAKRRDNLGSNEWFMAKEEALYYLDKNLPGARAVKFTKEN